jgi:tetratricopeptide (TPR) repeat protein
VILTGLAVACTAIVGSGLMRRGAGVAAEPMRATMGSATGSPAERRIAAARTAIDLHPKRADGWSELALALARRARETSDPAYYREAWHATEQALALEPNHLEARKLQVWILLGQHEFPRAVAAAEAINKQVPDDVLVYGFLVDGYTELGRYAEAEKAAQWMLDIRPGNVPALTRAAHLRELFGDHEGAVELMDTSYRRTGEAEVEDRAWILTQIAHLALLTCRTDAAERLLTEALTLFPDYHYALAQMAEVKTQQGRFAEAVSWREKHVRVSPHPENRYALGVALARAGRMEEAREMWSTFETAAVKESANWDSANIELVYYYADWAGRPADALALARREAARRQDVRTREAYAWALDKSSQSTTARAEIDKVLAVGVLQPETFAHAAAIAASQGDLVHAKEWAGRTVSMCAASPAAAEARGVIAGLDAQASVGGGELYWFGIVSKVLLLIGLIASLVYFYFSVAQTGVVGKVARFGIYVLMIGFGASFGYTVQGRLALAVGRAMDVLDKDKPPELAAQIHGPTVALVVMVFIVVGVIIWEKWYLPRRRPERSDAGTPPPDEDLPAF